MTPTPELVAWLACAVMAAGLVHYALVVLATRARLAVQRHDLVVEAKRLRGEYWRSIADRAAAEADVEVVEDEEPDAEAEDTAPLAQLGEAAPDAADGEPDTALRPAA
ncbi:MAG: hypothetical protein AAGB29_06885 [Planctomycetota bacterium]